LVDCSLKLLQHPLVLLLVLALEESAGVEELELLENFFHQVFHLILLPRHYRMGCLLVSLELIRIVIRNDLLEYLLQLLRILSTSQYRRLSGLVGLLDVALQVFVHCQTVLFIYLLLDFLAVVKDVENE
jgi:hypothetical protein